MKTNVVMESIDRKLNDIIIRQRTKDEFLQVRDVLKVINLHRLSKGLESIKFSNFLLNENIKEFMKSLELAKNCKVYYRGNKKESGWIHPYLAIKFLTHYYPELEIKIYDWLFDYLIKYRKDSGDSYVKMTGILFKHTKSPTTFQKSMVKLAQVIKKKIGCENWNEATKEQLERREYLHNMISDLVETLEDCKAGLSLALQAYDKKYNDNMALIDETH